MYRIIYRRSAVQAWTIEPQPSKAAAYARKHALRRALFAAVVQTQDAAGNWIDA